MIGDAKIGTTIAVAESCIGKYKLSNLEFTTIRLYNLVRFFIRPIAIRPPRLGIIMNIERISTFIEILYANADDGV